MTIGRSILITSLLVITSTIIGLLAVALANSPNISPYIIGLIFIIPNLLTYFLFFIYFRISKYQVSLKPTTYEAGNWTIIFTVFIFIIGRHFFNLPFNQWRSLSNEYLGTAYSIPNHLNYEFKSSQLYHVFDALVTAPLFEEIIFRYYIFGGLLTKYKLRTAIFVSSILFSLIHISEIVRLIPAFILGLFSALVYFRTKKLCFSILLHLIANILWFATLAFAMEYNQIIRQIGVGVFFWFIFLIGVIVLFFAFKKVAPRLPRNF